MNLIELTRRLIDIPSLTGDEAEVGRFLASHLEALGYRVETQDVGRGRANVLASASARPRVFLSTHMDTVPPFFPSSEDGDWIYGRGACDAKGAIAAMMGAVDALLDAGESGFGLLFVVGEETDSVGARVANEAPRGSRVLVDGEPTENRLALGSKGALYLEIEAEGRAAHSAYPELGVSAVDRLLDALARLRAVPLPSDPLLGETTLNIGTLEGGRARNVIADHARAEVLIRTVSDTLVLRERLLAAIQQVEGVRVAGTSETPAVRLGALSGFESTVVKFTTDVPRLTRWGEPYLLGPGSIHVAHTPGERIAKAELTRAVELYRKLVRRLQQEAGDPAG